jgi:hypothetical protein
VPGYLDADYAALGEAEIKFRQYNPDAADVA